MKPKTDIIKGYMSEIGAKGGRTKGKSKARTSAQARRAAAARWRKGKQ